MFPTSHIRLPTRVLLFYLELPERILSYPIAMVQLLLPGPRDTN
jgi:hypothetical protein